MCVYFIFYRVSVFTVSLNLTLLILKSLIVIIQLCILHIYFTQSHKNNITTWIVYNGCLYSSQHLLDTFIKKHFGLSCSVSVIMFQTPICCKPPLFSSPPKIQFLLIFLLKSVARFSPPPAFICKSI